MADALRTDFFSDIYHGETYDARREIPAWDASSSSRTKEWRPVDVFPAYDGELVSKVNEEIVVTQTLHTHRLTEPQSGIFVFDFGQNIAGICRLTTRGRRGQKITLKFGEMLNADGTVYRANLRTARATATPIFARAMQRWNGHHDLHSMDSAMSK